MASLYFLTSNDYKFAEYERLCATRGFSIERWSSDIQEIQEIDLRAMAHKKVLDAYGGLLHPVFVDVSGMCLSALDGLPGGLNRQFWNILHGSVCDLVRKIGDTSATMVVQLALCDGRRVYFSEGKTDGDVAPHESEVGTFHLDRIFVPKGSACVLSEMTDAERDANGPRSAAISGLVDQIRTTVLGRLLGLS